MKRKIKICHLASGDLWAGAENQIFNMVYGLSKNERLNITCIIYNNGVLANKLSDLKIKTYIINEKETSYLKIFIKTLKIIKIENVDIVHTHRYRENIIAAIIKLLLPQLKLVKTRHGVSEKYKGFRKVKSKVYQFLNHLACKFSFNILIAVSHNIEINLRNKFPSKKIVRISNSINMNHIKKSINQKELVRHQIGISEDEIIVGSVGRLVHVKAFHRLIELADNIKAYNFKVKFLLIGDGPLMKNLIEEVKNKKLTNDFLFLGFKENVYDYLQLFDIFVLTSVDEGMPTVILESMFFGCAILTTPVGEIPELIHNDVNGLVLNYDSNGYFKDSLKLLMMNNELREKFKTKNSKLIRFYDISNQSESLFRVYEEVLSGKI